LEHSLIDAKHLNNARQRFNILSLAAIFKSRNQADEQKTFEAARLFMGLNAIQWSRVRWHRLTMD